MVGKKEKQVKHLERVSDNGECGLARALGSNSWQTREHGLKSVSLWLSRKSDISDKDVMRLWKAIFYCYWHSDQSPVQVIPVCCACTLESGQSTYAERPHLLLVSFRLLLRRS
jgi:Nucleolar protein,Nop52